MFKTLKKEQFSVAYVKALAAPLGFNPDKYDVDDDSVDIFFKAKDYDGKAIENPLLHFQLKCTHRPFHSDERLHFSLPIKNYNDLRSVRLVCPTYLVVLCVPEDQSLWVNWTDENLLLRHAAYWVNLKGLGPAPDPDQEHVTVYLPKTNRFDLNSFRQMMDASSEERCL